MSAIPQHVTDHRLLASHRGRAIQRRQQTSAGDVAHQLWLLVDRCVEGLRSSADRGGPAPEVHIVELRRAMLRSNGRLGRRSQHQREIVDTVAALLLAQVDPRREPPAIPLVAPRTGQATSLATAVVRNLRVVDRVLHATG